jgi:uncharacterized membrane protein YdjX (TVP38/TMEM64 family)
MSIQQGRPVAPKRVQTLLNAGILLFALGAILGAILAVVGTTSTGLIVFFIILVLLGAGLSSYGHSRYRKTLG